MRTIDRRYARPVAFTAAAVVALVALVVVIALPDHTSGSAESSSAFAATRALDRSTGPFAVANAAGYNGTVTAGDLRIGLDGLVVSAAGDAAGTISVADTTADYRQVGSSAIARGGEKFWRGVLGDAATTVPRSTDWAHLDLTRFPDLAGLLTPARLAATLSGEQRGAPNGSDATPDARSPAITDPVVRRTADATLVSGDTTVSTDDAGTGLVGVRGRIGAVTAGTTQTPVVADVRVVARDASAADALYRDLSAQSGELARSIAPGTALSLSRSTARPAPGACTPPTCDADVSIVATATDPIGSLSIVATATVGFESRGRAVGRPCVRTVTLGRSGTARFRCSVTALPRPNGPFAVRGKFSAAVFAETPPATITDRVTAGRAMSTATATGRFRRAGVKTNAAAARYGTQITGLPSTVVYEVGDQSFDGRADDGVLLVTRGPGYSEHLDSGGALESTWPGYQQLLTQARAQKSAAGSTPVRWVFAEKDAAAATTAALGANEITGIEVVTVPAAG
ncbi:Tox-REase-5 domain-containing protein [Williamsia maris]|uniref:Restriction endonuclease fold toxin 5 n=1 Tax=Williamsia maris TaxID=72806 RepID=A0ABT1H8T6_9NOCA|nr:Tox-REase-5 domain-containing protein [Williamsia maris]MCP2174668.1 Restriction endonuclease fold toxin 5 [Williamsia maris]